MMMCSIHYPTLTVLLLVASLLETSSAFSLPSVGVTSRQHQSRLFGVLDFPEEPSFDDDEEDDDDDYLDDVDQLRKRLGSLISAEGTSTATTPLPLDEWRKQLLSPPPLTSIGRERLTTEITLLESLAESDDAVPELWNLWFNSRGPAAAEQLSQIEGLVMTGELQEAESLLRELISREGIHWVEPVNRLATLLFVSGRLDESRKLCELVLEMKPWHFGALSGMVQLCRGLKDKDGMQKYARKVMPSLKINGTCTLIDGEPEEVGVPTRKAWVAHMVEMAQANFQQAERVLGESFLSCDTVSASASNMDDADAWQ